MHSSAQTKSTCYLCWLIWKCVCIRTCCDSNPHTWSDFLLYCTCALFPCVSTCFTAACGPVSPNPPADWECLCSCGSPVMHSSKVPHSVLGPAAILSNMTMDTNGKFLKSAVSCTFPILVSLAKRSPVNLTWMRNHLKLVVHLPFNVHFCAKAAMPSQTATGSGLVLTS